MAFHFDELIRVFLFMVGHLTVLELVTSTVLWFSGAVPVTMGEDAQHKIWRQLVA